jgi:hypothetical protein
MISGNKNMALDDLRKEVVESFKAAYTDGHPVNWESESWLKSAESFKEQSEVVSEAILACMADRGDVLYVKGKLTAADIERGIQQAVTGYFEPRFAISVENKVPVGSSYRQKKVKAFSKELKLRARKLTERWKEQANVHFHVSPNTQKKVRGH